MMWWYGNGWMWFGMVLMVVFWIAVIFLIVWAIRQFSGRPSAASGTPPGAPRSNALDIARERYARGEISKEEYERIRRDLTS